MKEMKEVISKNIKKLLKEYDINQNELAKIADVSESTVGKWVLKKSTPRMGAVQKIADYFGLPKSYILEENKPNTKLSEYDYIHTSISAGTPLNIEGITKDEIEKIQLPDFIMGKWAGNKDIFLMRVNGESMNNVFSHGSLIAVKKTNLSNLHDGDIVVYSDNEEYAVKRIYIDRENKRFIFKPDSSDKRFFDKVINFDKAENLKIHGKVVLYIVEL